MHFTNCGVRLTARINIVRVLYTWRTYLCSHDGHVFSRVNMCLVVFNWQACHSSWLARVVKTRKGIVVERKKGKNRYKLGKESWPTFELPCIVWHRLFRTTGNAGPSANRGQTVPFFFSTFFYGISWYSRWSHYAFTADTYL